MYRLTALLVFFFIGCGDSSSTTRPTPIPAPPQEAFSLSGSVADTAYRSLGDARVEIIAGSGAGTFTRTDSRGRFLMPGTFSDTVTIRALREGYLPETTTVPPPNRPIPPVSSGEVRRWDVYLSLQPDGPSANLAGAYTLTLSADSACTNLPEVARTRTYTAMIVPGFRPTPFVGRLSDARIVPSLFSPYFEIAVAGDFTSANIRFVERLDETSYLAIDGGVAASVDLSGITAPFSAYFLQCRTEPTWSSGEYWSCGADTPGLECSSSNQLALVRR